MTRRWYDFKAMAGGHAELLLYDEIGGWFGVTAKQLIDEIRAAGELSHITLRINSPGGDVFDSLAIFNYLRTHSARVEVMIDGLAASGASIVAMAGDTIEMPANALMMIHNPSGVVVGTAEDMRELAAALDKMRTALISVYVARSGQTAEAIGELLDAETWLTAAEALELGLADDVSDSVDMAATARYDDAFRLDAVRRATVPRRPKIHTAAATPAQPREDPMFTEAQLSAMRAQLGLSASATAAEIMAAISGAAEGAAEASALEGIGAQLGLTEGASAAEIAAGVTGLCASVNALADRMDSAESDAAEARADRLLAQAVAEGKVTAQNRDYVRGLALDSAAAFEAWRQHAPRVAPTAALRTPARGYGSERVAGAVAGRSQKLSADRLFAPVLAKVRADASRRDDGSEADYRALNDDDRAALSQMDDKAKRWCAKLGVLPRNFERFNTPDFVESHNNVREG